MRTRLLIRRCGHIAPPRRDERILTLRRRRVSYELRTDGGNVGTRVIGSIESGDEALIMPSLDRLLPSLCLFPTGIFDPYSGLPRRQQVHGPLHGRRPTEVETNTASPAAEIDDTDPVPARS